MKSAALLIVFVSLRSALASHSGEAADCFSYDRDITDADLNNGLASKFDSAEQCQSFCYSYPGANFFTWSSTLISDPNYQRSCWCTATSNNVAVSPGVISGPTVCSGPTCCSLIEFASAGSLAQGINSQILGTYHYHSNGPDGKANYQHISGLPYMYYLSGIRMWVVGDVIGVNLEYASNDDTQTCPESLGNNWDWYNGFSFVDDPLATVYCTSKAQEEE